MIIRTYETTQIMHIMSIIIFFIFHLFPRNAFLSDLWPCVSIYYLFLIRTRTHPICLYCITMYIYVILAVFYCLFLPQECSTGRGHEEDTSFKTAHCSHIEIFINTLGHVLVGRPTIRLFTS